MEEFQIGQLSAVPVVARNVIGAGDLSDTYSFRLNSNSNLNITLTGLSSDADLRVYRDLNSNGVIDASDQLLNGGSSARGGSFDDAVNIANASAGTYIAEVYPFLSNNTSYDLSLSATDSSPSNLLAVEYDFGNLSGLSNYSDSVSSTDTTDVYRFSLSTGSQLTLFLTGLSRDADVRIIQDYNSNLTVDPNSTFVNGEVRATSTLGSSSLESISTFLGEGDYYVQVYQFSGDTNYTLGLVV